MDIIKKHITPKEDRILKEVKAIVLHWPAGQGVPSIQNVWDYMENISKNSYHYLVSGQDVWELVQPPYRAIHCGHTSYTDKAREIFGERATSNIDSPNNYSIGVCMIQDKPNGDYNTSTILSAVDLCVDLCIKYKLNPLKHIIRHTDVVGIDYKQCPLAFVNDEDLFHEFITWTWELKHSKETGLRL